jgi:GT2 family glycosyltransferase
LEVTAISGWAPASEAGCASIRTGSGSSGSRESAVEVSIIIVNWNSLEFLRRCLHSIYANRPSLPFEIVVVDNASPEGGIHTIREEFPEVIIVESETNRGFAGANNLGLSRATGNKILLLNPDTEIIGSALDAMLQAMAARPDAGIVGCKLLNTDRSISTTSIQKFPTILNQLLTAERVRLRFPKCRLWDIAPLFDEDKEPVKVDVIPGACMMLRRDVFESVGGMSEDYFMYGEDIDLNYKVNKAGYSRYYVGTASVIHHGGRSSSKQKVSQWSTIMTYRAMTRFYQKTRGRLYAFTYRTAMACAGCVRVLVLGVMYPFGNKQEIGWSISKWATAVRWAVGAMRTSGS